MQDINENSNALDNIMSEWHDNFQQTFKDQFDHKFSELKEKLNAHVIKLKDEIIEKKNILEDLDKEKTNQHINQSYLRMIITEKKAIKTDLTEYIAQMEKNFELSPADRNDILKLNINGSQQTLKRETMCSRGSMLQHMFCKTQDESFVRDDNSCIYLEWESHYFEIVKKWLIAKQFDENLPIPSKDLDIPDKENQFKFIKYLGLYEVNDHQIESSIIDSKDFEDRLRAFLPNHEAKLRLIQDTEKDGWTSDSFRNKCSNIEHTIVLVKVEGTEEIIGGQSDVKWTTSWLKTQNAFLFNLSRNSKHKRLQNNNDVIQSGGSQILVFDGGLDIHPHCNQNTSSIAYRFSDFPTYFETNGFGNLINNNDAVINFKVKNLEVFVIE